jgi:hypothetical protein
MGSMSLDLSKSWEKGFLAGSRYSRVKTSGGIGSYYEWLGDFRPMDVCEGFLT